MTEGVKPPGVAPLKAYRNREVGYSFIYPEDWHQFDLQIEDGHGVLFAPRPDDVSTSLSVEVRDIGTTVTADDLPTLRRGFIEGLSTVPGSTIESRDAYDVGFLIGLEARQTYRDGEHTRKRWIRLLFKDTLQVRLVAQGASPEDFDYWTPTWDPAMTTFTFGDVWPEPPPADPSSDPAHQEWLRSLLERQGGQIVEAPEDDPPAR